LTRRLAEYLPELELKTSTVQLFPSGMKVLSIDISGEALDLQTL
jgi:hypothetical protein